MSSFNKPLIAFIIAGMIVSASVAIALLVIVNRVNTQEARLIVDYGAGIVDSIEGDLDELEAELEDDLDTIAEELDAVEEDIEDALFEDALFEDAAVDETAAAFPEVDTADWQAYDYASPAFSVQYPENWTWAQASGGRVTFESDTDDAADISLTVDEDAADVENLKAEITADADVTTADGIDIRMTVSYDADERQFVRVAEAVLEDDTYLRFVRVLTDYEVDLTELDEEAEAALIDSAEGGEAVNQAVAELDALAASLTQ